MPRAAEFLMARAPPHESQQALLQKPDRAFHLRRFAPLILPRLLHWPRAQAAAAAVRCRLLARDELFRSAPRDAPSRQRGPASPLQNRRTLLLRNRWAERT